MKEQQSIWIDDFKVESNKWYSVSALCNGLGVGRKVIYKHVAAQNFKASSISQKLLIEGASIIEFLNRDQVQK
jgi:hypothetical protein